MVVLNWKLLTAFEAVARHRNFTRAAQELNVQQPAASRRVAELEAELGVKLLNRTRPFATLTREGEVLYRGISRGITQVHSATEQVRQHPSQERLTIDTTIGFASCYLMKRLPEFRAMHPGISIELISRDQNDAYGRQSDIVIAFDNPDRLPGMRKALIFEECMVATARPDVAASIGEDLKALSEHALLYLTMGLHTDDWTTFFDGTGLVPPAPSSDQKFTSFMVYLQAALNGDGVILGWETLLQDHFNHGLLAPITDRRIKTHRGYFGCLMPRAADRKSAGKFLDWIAGQG
jgi:LysR family glycine cleavage system transcriptional activator